MSTKYIQTLINSNLYPEPKIYKLVVQNSVFGIRHHTNTMRLLILHVKEST